VARDVAHEGDEDEILPVMEIHGVPRAQVEATLRENGLDIVTVQETDRAAGWHDYFYVAVKREPTPPRRRLRDLLHGRTS
jgi:hypothetical protein